MHYVTYNTTTIRNTKVFTSFYDNTDLVSARYPVRVSDYYANLIRMPDDAIWKQCMPDVRELDDHSQCADPLDESALSPVPGLIYRYPDRVVLLVSNRCPVYCRFCMRKRLVGSVDTPMGEGEILAALTYIAAHPAIHDVILSGGDPLMLDDASLSKILTGLFLMSALSASAPECRLRCQAESHQSSAHFYPGFTRYISIHTSIILRK